MKKIFSTVLICFIAVTAFTQNKVIVHESIQKVTIFRNSAQIESDAGAAIPAGENKIIIDDLPATIIPNSIQVSATGYLTILSVEYRLKSSQENNSSEQINNIKDSIERYSYLIDMQGIKKYSLDQEESLLLSNKELSSDKEGNIAGNVEDMADLFKNRLPDLKSDQYKIQKEINRLQKIKDKFQYDLNAASSGKSNGQIIVNTSADAGHNALLTFSYLVPDVSWTPFYDIRVDEINGPIQLIQKASVVQRTGVDWKNVRVILSTGNPTANTVKPVLDPYYINFVTYESLNTRGARSGGEATAYEISKMKTRSLNQADVAYAPVYQQEQAISTTYEINIPYSIPSNGTAKIIKISNKNIKAVYSYSAAPKLDNKAYLSAKINDWDTLNLNNGEANVYFENSFVGTTYINSQTSDDSLELTLGNDPDIIVSRTKINEVNKTKSIGGSKKLNITYQIDVRNTKSKQIAIDILDQIPIAQDKSIEVKTISVDGAIYDIEKGLLKWPLKLKPSEMKTVKFSYEIKYPKDKVLTGY